ncbi:hypothetical protein ACFOMD_16025 [Sphingoaurantiacus capsulatus]|uniref:Uncharacterized protein n=1 Tax=Sphingoaurantiacus capsulatus TaxID=1771310 RepID=A0ABV7XDB2_9SPHN
MSDDLRGNSAARDDRDRGRHMLPKAPSKTAQVELDTSHVGRARQLSPELFWVIVDAQK